MRVNRNLTIDGKAIERHPYKYPYSYTRFCIYKDGWQETDSMVYSDRLNGWYDNYYELYEKHLGRGQNLAIKDPKDIENFLCEYFKKKLKLTGIEQECNFMSGYPYWLLYYREETE